MPSDKLGFDLDLPVLHNGDSVKVEYRVTYSPKDWSVKRVELISAQIVREERMGCDNSNQGHDRPEGRRSASKCEHCGLFYSAGTAARHNVCQSIADKEASGTT